MRKRNRALAMLLALVMAFGLTGAAFAAGEDGGAYTDVPGWAKEYVDEMTEKGLIDGKTDTTFGAGDPMTRADLVTALYRLDGSPDVKDKEDPFQDVAADAAYRDAVVWAYDHKIVNGKSADTFDPEGSAQRQEIAKIVCRFAAFQVGRESLDSRKDEMSAYPDAADVDEWARDCMNWAVASQFITGSDGRLLPHGTATRAEVSAILCRYLADAATGDASKDDPRNQDGIGKKELLVVSFGTSFNDNRTVTIKAVEDAMDKAFPGYDVRRAFTADTIIEHIYRRDGESIDNVKQALERAKKNGVEELLVQPTHLMNGWEYGDLVKALEKYEGDFASIKIGAPLLTTDDDFARVGEAMIEATEELTADDETAVCWMGHGTEAASNGIYAKMQKWFADAGADNHFVGTVEAEPTARDLAQLVKEAGYTKVVLRPMMIVAGDHANNDMADEKDPESWWSVFTAAGLEVQCEIKGLGELAEIQALLADHAKNAKDLKDTGIDVEPNPNDPGAGDEPKALADGTYAIEVECEQSMFKIDSCTLTVKDGEMTARLVLGSDSFDKMFPGTAAAAKLAQEGAVDGETADGKTAFTLSVAELDKPLDYAAHSVRKDDWYDRTLTFDAASAQAK
ncbi:MAG: hypothetical protein HFF21_07515 [Oscillospiraceae bacterium]|jgi:sirohydrochlorin cobaltochelatase|nr:hypothetical protein [Oscillospiraceae bacterium]